MITTEKKIGRPTAWHAGTTTARTSPRAGRSPKCSLSRCMAFSAITTDESTSTPTETATPASDMTLVWTSATPSARSSHIIANDARAASGSVTATTNEVRRCPSTTTTQRVAVTTASTIVRVTVPTAPSISGVRS